METSGKSPFPETADIETSNDDYATRFKGAVGAWLLTTQERGVLKLLGKTRSPDAPEFTILDVGGGHGQLAHPLVREGYKVTVIGSDASCEHRIEDLTKNNSCRFEIGNVIALPYPDKSFDAVVAVRMLTHCGQWETLVKEMCRVARKIVITDYPTSQSLNAAAPALFGAKKKYEKNTREWRLFRHKEVRDAFASAGFAETGRYAQFFLPMVLHRALKCKPISSFAETICGILGLTRLWGTPVVARFEEKVNS